MCYIGKETPITPHRTRSKRMRSRLPLILLLLAACSDAAGPGESVRVDLAAAGFSHTCGLASNGALLCWGDDAAGQLGGAEPASLPCSGFEIPCRPSAWPVAGPAEWQAVDAGTTFTCALDDAGVAYCWGRNDRGQLGVAGPPQDCEVPPYGLLMDCRRQPAPVATTERFRQITAGAEHACALSTSGAAWCWGSNQDGRLGTGDANDRSSPAAVTGNHRFEAIAAGGRYTCGLRVDHRVLCWGANANGQLGIADIPGSPVPLQTELLAVEVAGITAATQHACAVSTSGDLYCWGDNAFGQIGTGTSAETRVPPSLVPLTGRATAASAGHDFTCALLETGAVHCWGANSFGQLGDGTRVARTGPAPIASGARFRSLSAGWGHACAAERTGRLLCWGINTLGQLGTGGTSDGESVPAPVTQD